MIASYNGKVRSKTFYFGQLITIFPYLDKYFLCQIFC